MLFDDGLAAVARPPASPSRRCSWRGIWPASPSYTAVSCSSADAVIDRGGRSPRSSRDDASSPHHPDRRQHPRRNPASPDARVRPGVWASRPSCEAGNAGAGAGTRGRRRAPHDGRSGSPSGLRRHLSSPNRACGARSLASASLGPWRRPGSCGKARCAAGLVVMDPAGPPRSRARTTSSRQTGARRSGWSTSATWRSSWVSIAIAALRASMFPREAGIVVGPPRWLACFSCRGRSPRRTWPLRSSSRSPASSGCSTCWPPCTWSGWPWKDRARSAHAAFRRPPWWRCPGGGAAGRVYVMRAEGPGAPPWHASSACQTIVGRRDGWMTRTRTSAHVLADPGSRVEVREQRARGRRARCVPRGSEGRRDGHLPPGHRRARGGGGARSGGL